MRKSGYDIPGNYLKTCSCGCGELIWNVDAWGHLNNFRRGHWKWSKKLNPFSKMRFIGKNHHNWKGGKYYHDGYIHVYFNGKHILEHRLIWENYNKACLLPWGIVHHKNEITIDNRIENLDAMMSGHHTTHHNKKRESWKSLRKDN